MNESEYRMERIQRLLDELKYEITRGMMEQQIDETIGFSFIIPVSTQIKGGVVWCEFRTRPVHYDSVFGRELNAGPALKLVKRSDE